MSKCFASFDNNELKIGNQLLSRTWRLTSKGLIPVSFLINGKEFIKHFEIDNGTLPQVKFQTFIAPMHGAGVDALHVILQFNSEKWIFSITDDLPAITVQRNNSAEQKSDFDNDNGEYYKPVSHHLKLFEYTLFDQTDHHDNLFFSREYRLNNMEKIIRSGVIFALFDPAANSGIVYLKHAPLPDERPQGMGEDFCWENDTVRFSTFRYEFAAIAFSGGENGITFALQRYQRCLRKIITGRDGLALSNTWGDRNRDGALCEKFILQEIDAAAEIGVDVVQIDDGWQSGVSRNSVAAQEAGGGYWGDYYSHGGNFWSIHSKRFPNGFSPLVQAASEKKVGLGLWFSPDSTNNFQHWQQDVGHVVSLYRNNGIKWFKIDGITVNTQESENNLKKFFCEIQRLCACNELVFDIDVTAQVRPGYFGIAEQGTIFVENRYSGLRRWWPFATFANLWLLSRVIAPVRLRMELLNPELNAEIYKDDPLAPKSYTMDWLFASVMVSSPLFWCELSNLSSKSKNDLQKVVPMWKRYRHELHSFDCLPVGKEPNGYTISGFFLFNQNKTIAHIVWLRDLSPMERAIQLLPETLAKGEIEIIAGAGSCHIESGTLVSILPKTKSWQWVRIENSENCCS